ncbi:MAG: DNA polymerase IV [Corynebacterium sp.]|nr:DNA polymerase IV [Corynebacterium sp.]
MHRWVIHVDMDAFFASCEQLTRPTLRGRPVLVGGISGRGVVAGASYEARELGAHSAMPMWQAQGLVGFRGVSVRPRIVLYKTISEKVFGIFDEVGDVVEQVSVDEAFIAVHALDTCDATAAKAFADDLRTRIRTTVGIEASVGIGQGKQIAKIASGLAKPAGSYVVAPEDFADVIKPLSVRKLWGVGPVTFQRLEKYGVHTIGELAHLRESEVYALLGKTVGYELWLRARGEDNRQVVPREAVKQISAEFTFAQDLRTQGETIAATQKAARAAFRRLQKAHKVARTVTVKLRMADFHIESRSATLPHATADYATLEALALKLVRFPEELGPIRLVGVGYSGFADYLQDVLFTPELTAPQNSSEVLPEPETSFEQEDKHWYPSQDVHHREFGHGWIQGIGHGRMTVRFETRTSGVGKVRTFDLDDVEITAADPRYSLDWEDLVIEDEDEVDMKNDEA